tara:strand:- start:215 stop:625 length:411 start_codon:yes stop_codon:yes gene_type:complete
MSWVAQIPNIIACFGLLFCYSLLIVNMACLMDESDVDSCAKMVLGTERIISERMFRSTFGIPKLMFIDIWSHVMKTNQQHICSPIDFLLFLYFLKVYPPSLFAFSATVKKHPDTLIKLVRNVCSFVLQLFPKVRGC